MKRSPTFLAASISLVGLALALGGCSDTDSTVEPATAELGSAPPATATPAPDASLGSQRMQGTWNLVLGDDEKRQIEVLKLALKDPAPTDAELTAAKLTDQEQMMVSLMAAARQKNPDDPKLKEMQAAANGLDKATVTITADSMTFAAGPVTETSTYVVDAQTPDSVTISSTSQGGADGSPGTTDKATLTFDGPDKLQMVDATDATKTQTFTRKK